MTKRGRPRHPDILTPREWEVLDLLREGLSNAEIGDRLGFTERTAKYHVAEILSKLDVDNRADAAAWRPDEHRPWWLAAGAPLAFLWRKANVSWLSQLLSGAVLLIALAGLSFLAFLLIRSDDQESTVIATASGEQIAFSFRGNIYAVRPDGSDLQRIIGPDNTYYSAPEFSPDGTRLAYIADRLRVIVADAADLTNVVADIDLFLDRTPPTPIASDFSMGPIAVHWSPDGELLLVTRQRLGGSGSSDVMLMNADGTSQRSILEAGTFIEATWWIEDEDRNVRVLVVGEDADRTAKLYDLNGSRVGTALPTSTAFSARASLQRPGAYSVLVRSALGSPEPFAPTEYEDENGIFKLYGGCGATWSPDGEWVVFYDGAGIVKISSPLPLGEEIPAKQMLASNADLDIEDPFAQDLQENADGIPCFGLGITWTANAMLATQDRALESTITAFSTYTDENLGISFEIPDTWDDGAAWMPYASCVGCVPIGPPGANPPYGIDVFAITLDYSGPDCGNEFGGCPIASYFGIRGLPNGDETRLNVAGLDAAQQRIFRQPPLGLTNDTGESRLYHQIATGVDRAGDDFMIVGFYREDDDLGRLEVETTYEQLLATLVVE